MKYLDLVKKKQGYKYTGIIVSELYKLTGEKRYVVENISEDCFGMLHIFNQEQLEIINTPKLQCSIITDNKIYLFLSIKDIDNNQEEKNNNYVNELDETVYEYTANNKYQFIYKLKMLLDNINNELIKSNINNITNPLFSYDIKENNKYYTFQYILNKLNVNVLL